MSDDKLDTAIKTIEDFYFGENSNSNLDCGEKLFIDFAKKYKNKFLNSKISDSTENKFEFTQLHQEFQSIYESKLEELINKSGMNIDDFYEGIKNRCDEGDQEVILFVDILNAITDYNSFMEMMANLVNKV